MTKNKGAELLQLKRKRAEAVNELITVIASCGRHFFQHESNLARLEVDDRGRVWWHDDYTKKRIYTHSTRHRWRGFTHGGTLRDLVVALRDYVCTGSPKVLRHFGPWPSWYSGTDPWGYGPHMGHVRAEAVRILSPLQKVKDESSPYPNNA